MQSVEFLVIATAEAHGKVRALPRRQQFETTPGQPGDGRQVDRAEAGKAAPEQVFKGRAKDGEDRNAQ